MLENFATPSRGSGEDGASQADALFADLYAQLRRIARRELARRGVPVSLSPTTLLHEAYLGMARNAASRFPDEAHFLGYAARVMRGLIIDFARRRQALKRGGEFLITSFKTGAAEAAADPVELGRIGDALEELSRLEPALAQVVDLKFFCGFSFAEIAAMQGTCERTVQRQWEKARIFLHRSLRSQAS